MEKVTCSEFQTAVMDKFKAKFIKDGIGYKDENGSRNLLWCFLNDNYKESMVMFKTKDLTEVLGFSPEPPIYIYFDRAEELFRATVSDFFQYLIALEKWEMEDTEFDEPWGWAIDAEIFDETLEWAISVTHEDVSILLGFEPE